MSKPRKRMVVGERNGRLVAVERIDSLRWRFKCDCGNEHVASVGGVRFGNTRSCGCLQSDLTKERNARTKRTHGMRGSPEYIAWLGMKSRCRDTSIKDYGGRGITVYGPWQKSFVKFFNHVGPKPSARHSIDRVNNSKGYFPGNVRWATIKEQQRNRRGNHEFIINGRKMCAEEASEVLGLPVTTIYARLKYGWAPDRIIATPLRKWRNPRKT